MLNRLKITVRLAALSFLLAATFATGCSGRNELPRFRDLESAPQAIQTAAQAVVRIHTAGEYGTGSFISATGLLLTNNHVLGAPVCPVEGCSVQLSFMHQRGAPRLKPVNVFGVPVAVSVGLDMAVVQVYASSTDARGEKLSTPNYLTFAPHEPASLTGAHVNIVGHPQGTLKKWTEGTVVDAFGSWFESTAYTLPGDSGSPVLDDGGKVVGLIHRGSEGEDLITNDGDNVFSVGTASAPLLAARKVPLPEVMISTAARTTPEFVVDHNHVWLNGRAATAQIGEQPRSVLSILGDACDKALARQDFQSPDELSTALSPCRDAMLWIECRTTATHFLNSVCPSINDAAAWAERFQGMNGRLRAMNGKLDLGPVSDGIASLTSKADGAESLVEALAAARPAMDFNVAAYLAEFGVASYGGQSTVDFVRAFAGVPHYQLFADYIFTALCWLNNNGTMSDGDTLANLSALDSDPEVSVGSKLFIEEAAYNRGWNL